MATSQADAIPTIQAARQQLLRAVGLVLIPIVSGLALATWDVGRQRGGEGRGRASFWAGAAFGTGYVAVRLVVVWLVRVRPLT